MVGVDIVDTAYDLISISFYAPGAVEPVVQLASLSNRGCHILVDTSQLMRNAVIYDIAQH